MLDALSILLERPRFRLHFWTSYTLPPTLSSVLFRLFRPCGLWTRQNTLFKRLHSIAMTEEPLPDVIVPDGYKLHTENTSRILLPDDNGAFLNPVQEFNRDLSVACIRTWGDVMNEEKKRKFEESQAKKAGKKNAKRLKVSESAENGDAPPPEVPEASGSTPVQRPSAYHPQKFTILEALSATGLRSIRYAKEIPLVNYVIANDLSESAAEAMRRNVDLNGLGESKVTTDIKGEPVEKVTPAKVRVNEGDACALMYNHRTEKDRVSVVDLDPYGTAAPFIDAAVQCVKDGGLLCVTCTDLSVLASTNYPEKCYSNYGGVPVKAEYCHEAAVRIVLHTIATSAARYGRYIKPVLSLSIDFYVRMFVRVATSPIDVKKWIGKSAIYYVCSGCQDFHEQPIGRCKESVQANGGSSLSGKTINGPTAPELCKECHQSFRVAGPMWSGPLHETEFVSRALKHVEENESKYGTASRMKGMLTLARDELEAPFYFTPSKVCSFFHCTNPPLDSVASALLHAGHKVSRSHTTPGSLKTDAKRADIHDIFRSWIKENPVKMERIQEGTVAFNLLSKEPRAPANFKHHPDADTGASQVKLVRYQMNPPNWGPGTKASERKRKREQGVEQE